MKQNKTVKTIVLTGYGTNCEVEMAHACRLAGAEHVEIVHMSELIHGKKKLDDYHFLNLPGGFLDGDDLGAGQAGAHRFQHAGVTTTGRPLREQLEQFIAAGKLVLGVCNGFQLMVKMGLLPGIDNNYNRRSASLTYNDSGRFEDRWTYLKVNPESPCVYTKNADTLYLPVRHGEGKFVVQDRSVLEKVMADNQHALQYADPVTLEPTGDYPANPNGSPEAIAGICDPTGRLFGLMPHPEAFLHRTNHPRWTREELPDKGAGLLLFENAVSFIRDNLLSEDRRQKTENRN